MGTHRFKVHSAGHAAHAAHSWHSAHAAEAGHAPHAPHTGHPAAHHVGVVLLDGLAVLLVLVDPLGEVGLDELRADLLLRETRPVLGLGLLLAEVEDEGAGGELVGGGLEQDG